MGEEELSLGNQRSLYRYILANPGAHLRSIAEGTAIPLGTVRYHLDFLEGKGVVVARRDANLKTYFIDGKLPSEDRRITPLLRQKRFRDIVLALIITPGATHSQVCDELDIKPPTLTKYMGLLEERGLVASQREGREKRYTVQDEGRIIRLLLAYRESFWDRYVDSALEIYFER